MGFQGLPARWRDLRVPSTRVEVRLSVDFVAPHEAARLTRLRADFALKDL